MSSISDAKDQIESLRAQLEQLAGIVSSQNRNIADMQGMVSSTLSDSSRGVDTATLRQLNQSQESLQSAASALQQAMDALQGVSASL